MIRVAFADDSPEMRIALRAFLGSLPNIELVCESNDGQEALECVKNSHPDVLVMDIHMPVLNGYEATEQIIALSISTQVILISADLGSYIATRAATAGAKGYIPKDSIAKSLLLAIETVYRGEMYFLPFTGKE